MGKPNPQNLKPQNTRTKEEQRRIARMGGKVSGENRRKRKTMREMMERALMMAERNEAMKKRMIDNGWEEDEDLTQMAVITQGTIMKAKAGDIAAYNAIRDITGEKPVDEKKITGNLQTKIQIEFVSADVEPVTNEAEIDLERHGADEMT